MNINKLFKKNTKITYYKSAKIKRDVSPEIMEKYLKALGKSFIHLKNCDNWAITGDRTESHILLTIQCNAEAEGKNG